MKCPYCKNELKKLVHRVIIVSDYWAELVSELDGRQVIRTNILPFKNISTGDAFICSECGRILTFDRDRAREILLEK